MEDPIQQVSVRDVSMPFGSMVVFILKWTLASIPAMIIIFLVVAIIASLFGGMFMAFRDGTSV